MKRLTAVVAVCPRAGARGRRCGWVEWRLRSCRPRSDPAGLRGRPALHSSRSGLHAHFPTGHPRLPDDDRNRGAFPSCSPSRSLRGELRATATHRPNARAKVGARRRTAVRPRLVLGRHGHPLTARTYSACMKRIEDYALLGDLQTAALVGREGSIDWCCFPRFDSGACFAALLGEPEHGRWLLAPAWRDHALRAALPARHADPGDAASRRPRAQVRVIDFMPPRERAPDIVRIVEGVHGRVPMRSELVVRFDYGRIVPWVRRVDDARVAIAGPDALCSAHAGRRPRRGDDHGGGVHRRARAERMPFVLTWYPVARAAAAAGRCRGGARRDGDVLARVGRRLPASRATTTKRSTSRCWCSRRSPTSRPAGSWPRRRPRCRSGSAACATGTTATAGCVTRP